MSYAQGAGFYFAFLNTTYDIGFLWPFPKVHDFKLLVDGRVGSRISE